MVASSGDACQEEVRVKAHLKASPSRTGGAFSGCTAGLSHFLTIINSMPESSQYLALPLLKPK